MNDIYQALPPASRTREQQARERIPEFAGDPNNLKQSYLAYTALGFGVYEACKMVGIRPDRPRIWRTTDAQFAVWEAKLREEKTSFGADLVLEAFHRNMWLAMGIDFKIMMKAEVEGLDKLSDNEISIYKAVRSLYGPDKLVAMMKAVAPEGAEDGSRYRPVPNITVIIEGRDVDNLEAKQAAARNLLMDFVERSDIIEGQFGYRDPDDT
jgi:hypothetical protein